MSFAIDTIGFVRWCRGRTVPCKKSVDGDDVPKNRSDDARRWTNGVDDEDDGCIERNRIVPKSSFEKFGEQKTCWTHERFELSHTSCYPTVHNIRKLYL